VQPSVTTVVVGEVGILSTGETIAKLASLAPTSLKATVAAMWARSRHRRESHRRAVVEACLTRREPTTRASMQCGLKRRGVTIAM